MPAPGGTARPRRQLGSPEVRRLLVECRLVDVVVKVLVVLLVLVLVLRRRLLAVLLRGPELVGLRVVLPRGLVLPWRPLLMESVPAVDAVLPGGATRAPRLVVPVAPPR